MKQEEKVDFRLNREYCKACGICTALCPKKAISADDEGKPSMINEEACIMCRLCELRCPDFAIRIGRMQ
ncbi:MAG: 4Fe-4S binding protein [Eubacteriaceae bacterium]|jgi:2-oxoglutarate ferredoxin oxidoreductase subunit delta|nr:4Fe-4S binding protein [Eubacteriaceae bacterium]